MAAVISRPVEINLKGIPPVSSGATAPKKISNHYNINETFTALAKLKDGHNATNFDDLISQLDDFSKTTMRRPYKTDCPSAGTFTQSRFNQS